MNLQTLLKSTLQTPKQKQLRLQMLSHHKVHQQSLQRARWRQHRVLRKRPPSPLNPRHGVQDRCTLQHLLPPPPNDVEPTMMVGLPLTLLITHLLLYRFVQGQLVSRGRQINNQTLLIHCLELLTSQNMPSTKASVTVPYLPHHPMVGSMTMVRRIMTNLEFGPK